jgi:diacylglycerol kinase (ATP)
VIVNPVAGRGKTKHDLTAIRSAFASVGVVDFRETQASGDEETLAREAIGSGANTLVAVGGDGTCSRVANAILNSGTTCRLGVVPTGTGNDFAKSLGVERYAPQEIAALVERELQARMDVGRVEGRFFINSCGFGFDASVLEATKRVRILTGDAVYIYSALRQLFTYQGMRVSVDSSPQDASSRMLMVTVSNGEFLGGAFQIAPEASVRDGSLDVGLFNDAGLMGRVRIFAGAFRGTHIGLPSVETKRVPEMTLRFSTPPMMEVDGELKRALSSTVKIECVPRALGVIAAPGYPR